MDVESRFAEILQIKDRQEEAVAIRRLMDDFESERQGYVKSFYAFNLGAQHMRDHPELGLECYYLSAFLNIRAWRAGKEQAAHDIDYEIQWALTMPEVNTSEVWRTIAALETKYDIYFFTKRKFYSGTKR